MLNEEIREGAAADQQQSPLNTLTRNGADRRLELVLCASWETWGKAEILKAERLKFGRLKAEIGGGSNPENGKQK
jgi:hypothetical protein